MTERARGCLPRVSKVGDGTFRIFGDPGIPTPKLIPERDYDKWSPSNHLVGYHWHAVDQGRQNSCCGVATIDAMLLGREQAGQDQVVLSQASVYALGNGGRDQGMAIDTALKILTEIGTCPASVIDPMDWEGYRQGDWPENWREVAKSYRLLEAFDCPTFDHAMSAVFCGYPVVYGTDGHAVVMMGRRKGGQHYDLTWAPDWGDNGIGQWRSDATTAREIPRYGAWAIRVATDPTNDGDVPAMAKAVR